MECQSPSNQSRDGLYSAMNTTVQSIPLKHTRLDAANGITHFPTGGPIYVRGKPRQLMHLLRTCCSTGGMGRNGLGTRRAHYHRPSSMTQLRMESVRFYKLSVKSSYSLKTPLELMRGLELGRVQLEPQFMPLSQERESERETERD